jgi:hypothetical protein
VEIKCQLDATDGVFFADLIACSTRFGHHYTHHQELKSIIQWLLSLVFGAVKMVDVLYKLNGIRVFWVLSISNYLYNILEFLMMGIMVPETC